MLNLVSQCSNTFGGPSECNYNTRASWGLGGRQERAKKMAVIFRVRVELGHGSKVNFYSQGIRIILILAWVRNSYLNQVIFCGLFNGCIRVHAHGL